MRVPAYGTVPVTVLRNRWLIARDVLVAESVARSEDEQRPEGLVDDLDVSLKQASKHAMRFYNVVMSLVWRR